MSRIASPLMILFAACIIVGLAAPAKSEAEGLKNYVALRGGIAIPQNMDLQSSGGSGSEMSFDNGYNLSAAFGRRLLPWLRGEVEVGWMEMKADELRLKRRGVSINDDGKDKHLYGMLNFMADLKNSTPFTPYVGLGLGITRASLENKFVWPGSGSQISRDSSDTAFAYQAMLGVIWNPAPNWNLELRGRYFGSNDREHDNHSAGTTASMDVDGSQIWIIDFGVGISF